MADRTKLYGLWGDEKQCNRVLIAPTGTVFASPFEIRPDWIHHGNIWCHLTWISTESSSRGIFAYAVGVCGEDDLRNHRISFDLTGDQLVLLWNDQIENGPLKRCSAYTGE